MDIINVILVSYVIGSIPTAYLITRIFFRKNIIEEGSGNVGTLNFFRVTHSVPLAIAVLGIDIIKGFSAVWFSDAYFPQNLLLLASVSVILGHIYPVWLAGKGGRGLATLAGIFLFIKPVIVLIWWILFGFFYFLGRKYILSGMLVLFVINIMTAILYSIDIFLILSVNSLLVMLKYIPRIKDEIIKKST